MLEELTIRDFAIIDRLSIHFDSGLNLLTGETGAGKSILIGAMGFILGAKADTGIIPAGVCRVQHRAAAAPGRGSRELPRLDKRVPPV